jgi:hypothetical protein
MNPEVRKPAVKPNAVPVKKTGKLAEVIGEWETDGRDDSFGGRELKSARRL